MKILRRAKTVGSLWLQPASVAMKCNIVAENETLFSAYPWTDSGEVRPVQLLDYFDYDYYLPNGRFLVRDGVITGGISDPTGNAGGAGASLFIDLGGPARKITTTARMYVAQGKKDWEIKIRYPYMNGDYIEPRNFKDGTPAGNVGIYHSIQLLRAVITGDITTNPAEYVLNLWGIGYYGQILAQHRIKSEIVWQASNAYTKVIPYYTRGGIDFYKNAGPLRGHCVIPAGGGTRKFECLGNVDGSDGGVSGGSQPAAFATAAYGDIVTDGTVRWVCTPNIDYQLVAVPVEIIDTGTMIQVTVGAAPATIIATVWDSTNYQYPYMAINSGHSAGDVEFGPIQVWI